MASNHADATVAIPWFNNIWLNDVAARVSASTPPADTAVATSTRPTRRARPNQAPGSPSPPVAQDIAESYDAPSRNASPSPARSGSGSYTQSENQAPSQLHSVSSSRHTISTLSAIDRISLISLFSTGCLSASDVLRTLSDPDLFTQRTHTHTSTTSLALADRSNAQLSDVDMHFLPIRSAPQIYGCLSSRRYSPSNSADDHGINAAVNKNTTDTKDGTLITTPVVVRRAASTPPLPPQAKHLRMGGL